VQRCFADILTRVDEFESAIRSGNLQAWLWTAVAYHRLVSRGMDIHDPKRDRLVAALEKAEPIWWKRFSVNMQDAEKRIIMPGGVRANVAWYDLPQIDLDMQIFLDEAEKNNRIVVSGDLSNFDATIPPWMIADMGNIIDAWLATDLRLGEALCYTLAYRTQLITPVGIYPAQPSSMKSGSGGTNNLDSKCNKIVHYYGEEIGLYKIHNLTVQGDDFCSDGEGVTPEAIEEVFKIFGMEANKSKQMYIRGVLSYLQKIHIRGVLGGAASVYRALNSSLTYERLRYKADEWNAFAEIARTLSQLETTAFSPFFEVLVDFVKRGDRYNLGANLPPSQVLARAGNAGRETIQRDEFAAWKSGSRKSGFDGMAVNRVLRGEKLPPWGSRERFYSVYGDRANE
jgi:hypothetical protein